MGFTVPELAWIAQQGGFTGSTVPLVVAFMMRESSGNPGAIGDIDNPHKGCRSYGLLQINVCPGGQFSENPQALLDPIQNAKAAFQRSKGGTDFGPWGYGPTAYRSGVTPPNVRAVELELAKAGGAKQPANLSPAGGGNTADPSSSGSSSSSGGLEGIAALGAKLTDPNTWKRVAMVVGGLVLMGGGLYVLNQDLVAKAAGKLLGTSSSSSSSSPGPDDDDESPTLAGAAGSATEGAALEESDAAAAFI